MQGVLTKLTIQRHELRARPLVEPEDPVPERVSRIVDRDERLTLVGDAHRGDRPSVDARRHLSGSLDGCVPPLAGVLFSPPPLGRLQVERSATLHLPNPAAVPGPSLAR